MGSYVYLTLIVAGIAVFFFMWRRGSSSAYSFSSMRRDATGYFGEHQYETSVDNELVRQQLVSTHSDPILKISVFAKGGSHFASYDLLQSIAATGMHFGEMNIFHYYHRTPKGERITLFSLASATKPGVFDLNRMGNFSCIGLTLFMDATQVPNPLQAFHLMVNTAEQLADDLEGELRSDPKTIWTQAYFEDSQQRIMQLEPA